MYEFGVIFPFTQVAQIRASLVSMEMALYGINTVGYYETDIEDENGQSVMKVLGVLFDNVAPFTGDRTNGYEYCGDDANGKPMYTRV